MDTGEEDRYALVLSQTLWYIFALNSDVITSWDIKPQNRKKLPPRPFPAVEEDDLYFIFLPISYESETTELKKVGETVNATTLVNRFNKVISPRSCMLETRVWKLLEVVENGK